MRCVCEFSIRPSTLPLCCGVRFRPVPSSSVLHSAGPYLIARVVRRLLRLCASQQFPVSASNRHRRNYVFALRSALGFSTKNPKRGITSGHRPMLRFGNNKWDWLSLHPTLWRFTVAIPCELPHSADSVAIVQAFISIPADGWLKHRRCHFASTGENKSKYSSSRFNRSAFYWSA
jgi:hypothetical protein